MMLRLVVASVALFSVACAAGSLSDDGQPRGSGGSSISVTGAGGIAVTGAGGGGVIGTSGSSGQGDPACDSKLEVTYRDFSQMHPDFEMAFRGDVVRRKLIGPALGPDKKPVFLSRVGCPAKLASPLACDNWMTTEPVITSAESFGQWYRTTAGVNIEFAKQIDLVETPPGSGQYAYESAAFFPLGPTEGFGITPPGNHLGQNFLFTTEIHVRFGYTAGHRFTFRGDDDLFIFVNGVLALDLGSLHGATEGTIDFDAQATALGIVPGNTYAMDIFLAERHTEASCYQVTTNISCFAPGADVQ
jgi:fibro-slime domain-containing protein